MELSVLFLVKIKGGNMSRKQRVKPSIERQRGRSMVEMLGVLALVGVLSIGGVVGYQYAMQIFRENQTLNAFSATTAGARTADLMDTYFYSCANFPCVVEPKYVISGVGDLREGDFSTAVGAPVRVQIESENGYTVRIRGVSRVLCETLKQGRWEESCAGIDPTGNTAAPNGCSEGFLGDLANVDCNSLPQANSGLARRSALQEQVDTDGLGWINFDDAGHPAFVLYYHDRHADAPIPDEPYNPDDPDVSDEQDNLYCIEGEPRDSEGHITKTCCNEAGGRWRNNLCCVNSGANEGSLFTSPSTLKEPNCWCLPNGSGGISPKSIKSNNTADPFCCHAAGLTWKNGECCNGDKTWDFKFSSNCGNAPDEFCPTPHVIQGSVCCEVGSDDRMTGRDYRSGLQDSACMIIEPKPTCDSFGCDNGFTATEKNNVCCCGEINARTNLRDTSCYSEGPTCSDKGGECFDSSCSVCCSTEKNGKTTDNNVNRWCCDADGGVCSDSSCTVCCEKDSTGKAIDGKENSVCEAAPITCNGLGGECADDDCTICCNPNRPGRDMNGDEQELCKPETEPTCTEQNGIEVGLVCCTKDDDGNLTGYEIDGVTKNSVCEPTPICDEGVVVGIVCCQKDRDGNKTGYEVDGTKNSVCEPTCDELGGECSDSSCTVCCEKDTNGDRTGKRIDGTKDPLCRINTECEPEGICINSSCSICCERGEGDKLTGYTKDGEKVPECEPYCADGICIDEACTICCATDEDGNKTGKTIEGQENSSCTLNPHKNCEEDKGGECSDSSCTVCCSKDGDGKDIYGKLVDVCCSQDSGECVDSSCSVCCDPSDKGKTISGENNDACVAFYCPSPCVVSNGVCCNSEDMITNANPAGSILEATLCGTTDQQHSACCGVSLGTDYYIRDNFED